MMEEAGLVVRSDLMGNIFGRFEGQDPSAPVSRFCVRAARRLCSYSYLPTSQAILTGSHTDAIPLSGMYDGVLGVLGGIEALRALRSAGFKPKRSLEVVMFTSEEPTRFGLSCSGRRDTSRTAS